MRTHLTKFTTLFALGTLAAAASGMDIAAAEPCPGHAGALGTARVIAVDAAAYPRVGRKHFKQTLPLAPKEVVLTSTTDLFRAPRHAFWTRSNTNA